MSSWLDEFSLETLKFFQLQSNDVFTRIEWIYINFFDERELAGIFR